MIYVFVIKIVAEPYCLKKKKNGNNCIRNAFFLLIIFLASKFKERERE